MALIKKLTGIVLFFCLLLNANIFAQVPQGIPYQAIARNAAGTALVSQGISLRFSIHDLTATGTVVYKEAHSVTTNAFGLFSITIGQGTAITGTFGGINWGTGSKFTEVEIDITGGSNFISMGSQQMLSVPYALYAGKSTTTEPVEIGPKHYIGESYGGGIVFFVYNNGQSGLIATDGDMLGVWGQNANSFARANGVGGGLKNTSIIIGAQVPGDNNIYAATHCNSYSINLPGITYGDWYLPSKYELNLLYLQKAVVGNFSNNAYWSSTELDAQYAWGQNFFDGGQFTFLKNNFYSIRPIRAFYGNDVRMLLPASITTTAVSAITTTSATSGGNISSDGGQTVTARGVCWSTSSNPTTALSTKTTNGTGTGSFTSSITGLTSNTTYYVRAYATTSVSTVYGNEISFTTVQPTAPSLTTNAVTSITGTTAVSGGNITNDGGASVTVRGVCWSTNPNPTTALTTKTTDGAGAGFFSSNIAGLNTGTTYYVRAYATSGIGTAYGNERSFTTLLPASITTTATSLITSSTATSGGNITTDGGSAVTARGVCWSTSTSPTIALTTKTSDGNGAGSFTSVLTGLTSNTTYYVRAYATTAAGTSYGNEVSFTTMAPTPAVLSTTAASSITSFTALSGGNITDDGGSAVTVRGVCWSTSPNPTTALLTKTTDGAGSGSFTSNITGLSPSTTYYVKAYATNSLGTYYGNEISLATNNGIVTLNTLAACTSGTTGGNITSDGGDPITVRGVCYSTIPNPTTAGNKTIDGSGTGIFSSNIPGLTANTTYYVRAYATNGVSTYYGNQVSFTTASTIYSVGQAFGGGIIFYVDCTGLHGLIAASTDQSSAVIWGPYLTTGAAAAGVGTGQANTNAIVTAAGAGTYAASICNNLTLNGQTDWFLPSKDELDLLYRNRAVVGGFAFALYWSSTEQDSDFAWYESFFSNGGGQSAVRIKGSNTPGVRAIRAF